MKRLLLYLLPFICATTHAQQNAEAIMYVIDSVAIIDDPGEAEGTLTEDDIEVLTVVTDKAEIADHGYKDLDKIIFITTKEYARRPADVKRIPTVKQMERRNGQWHIKGSPIPYSGRFIDYYLNGKKQGDGSLKDGRLEGVRTVYYQDGTVSFYRSYVAGIEHGESKEYFRNGNVRQEGIFLEGKENGLWKQWYSTGILKRQTEFDRGEVRPTREEERFHSLFSKGIELFNDGYYSAAIKSYNKALELNPRYSDLYFHRSRAYLYDLRFDEALIDCDRAIELEPMYREAYSNRAFVRLRKHELKDSRTLGKSGGVTILASKDNVEIPDAEREKICADLKTGYELGDRQQMIVDAIENYCN